MDETIKNKLNEYFPGENIDMTDYLAFEMKDTDKKMILSFNMLQTFILRCMFGVYPYKTYKEIEDVVHMDFIDIYHIRNYILKSLMYRLFSKFKDRETSLEDKKFEDYLRGIEVYKYDFSPCTTNVLSHVYIYSIFDLITFDKEELERYIRSELSLMSRFQLIHNFLDYIDKEEYKGHNLVDYITNIVINEVVNTLNKGFNMNSEIYDYYVSDKDKYVKNEDGTYNIKLELKSSNLKL